MSKILQLAPIRQSSPIRISLCVYRHARHTSVPANNELSATSGDKNGALVQTGQIGKERAVNDTAVTNLQHRFASSHGNGETREFYASANLDTNSPHI